MVTESSSSSTTVPAAKGLARTLAQHHQAVVGFLFGFFVILVLYTTVSGQFGSSTNAIVVLQSTPAEQNARTSPPQPSSPASAPNNSTQVVLQSTPAEQNARTSPPPQPSAPASAPNNSTQVVLQSTPAEQNARTSPQPSSPASAPNNSTQDNVQKDDVNKTMGEERIQDNVHGSDKNNKTDANFDNQANRTDQSGQPVNNTNASDKKMEEELIQQELDQDDDKNDTNVTKGAPAPRKPICDLSDPRYDICEISGDARATNRTVLYVPPPGERGADGQEWAIKDQSRKYLEYIHEVTVKSLSAAQSLVAPECTSRHAVPALVFAMNGLTSNPWHDFSDVLVPLFITARAFDGEVQFLVTDLQPWFVDKYRLILSNLSRYDIVDFNKDAGVRCYPHLIVGLRSHRDLGINPTRAPRNYTLLDFRMYIRDIFSLPPDSVGIPYKEATHKNATGGVDVGAEKRKPRLMLINRGRNRKFVNVPEITDAARAAGFEVLVVEPRRDLRLEEFSRMVDSCDVLMGAHGAGLTNFFFLRTNAVMLQVVPWGHMEFSSMVFYGRQAKEMMLHDVEYSITAEESTLYEKYGKDHPAVRDPESIHKQGWQLGMKYYWLEQDIRLNVTRFAPTLHQVLRTLGE